MKDRTITLLLVCSLIISVLFCGCKKSEDAAAVEKMIEEIGAVTLESVTQIEQAENAFALLKKHEQKNIENLTVLQDARKKYDQELAEYEAALVADVTEKISSIGEVTRNSAELLQSAREAFEQLPEELRTRVENADILAQAEDRYIDVCASYVDKLIGQIGKIILRPGEKTIIDTVREAFNQLDDDAKARVTKKAELEAAEAELLSLKVADVEDAIKKIGEELTLDDVGTVADARKEYDLYSEEVAELISNYDVLTNAEAKLSELRVEKATALIDGIGTVTLQSGDAISEASRYYKSLVKEEQDRVENAPKIKEAETEYSRLEKEENKRLGQEALARLNKEEDKVTGQIWYNSKVEPVYMNSRSNILPYIGKNGNSVRLVSRYNYAGRNWVFWENLIISVDGKNYYKTFSYWDVNRDSGGGMVGEIADADATEDDIAMLRAIAASKETIVRFQGDNNRADLTVSSSDKNAIKDVLTAYEYLKSYPNG